MKRISVTIIAVLVLFAANAQITKGSILLGGNAGFETRKMKTVSNNDEYDQNNFYFSPVIGKAIRENLVVGFQLSYNQAKNNYSFAPDKSTSKGYGGGVFARKYKQIKSSGFYLFGQGGLNADFSVTKNELTPASNNNEERHTSISLGLTPGVAYAVSKRFHLETGLNNIFLVSYKHTSQRSGDPLVETAVSNSFGASTTLNSFSGFNLGFRFFLSK